MYRGFLIPVLACALALTLGEARAAVDRDQSQRYYEDALEFFRSEAYSETAIQLRNALQQDANNLPARIMLGNVLLRQNQPRAAIKELEKAQAMGGDENLILIPLASAYMEIAEPEHVITGFVAQGHKPEVDGELQLMQAEAYLQLGDKKRSEELYLSAGTLLPVDPRPIIGRAQIQLSKGKTDRARALVGDAVRLAPQSFTAWMFKAIFHRDHHEYDDAIAAFEKVLAIDPTSGRALTARAAMWMDVGQVERAKKDLAQVGNLESDTLETIYLRTLIMFREGKAEEARELLRESAGEIREIKEDYRAKMHNTKLMLGVVAFFEQNYAESITHLKAFLARFPNHLGAKRYLASAYLSTGDFKEVIRLYKPSARSDPPRDPMALSVLAEAYRAMGDFATAEEYFAAALKLAPNVAGIGVRLATSRLDSGRAEAAREELERLTARFPDMLDAWMQLVRVYTKTGETERAVKAVEAMLERFGDNPQVHNLAGATYLAAGRMALAQNHLRLAAQLDSEMLLPRLNLARLAVLQNEKATAEAQYRSTLERFPQSTEANLELAALLSRQGDIEEALQRVNDTLRYEPMLFRAHELKLNLIERQTNDVERIRNAVYDLVKNYPDEARADLVAGKIYRRIGDQADARVHFRRAVEKAQFETEILYAVANQQYGITDFNGALWSLTKAEQGSPGNMQVGVLKAAVLIELKELDQAADGIAKLFEKHGNKPEIHTVNGDLLMAREQPAAAAAEYRAAHEQARSFATARTYFRALVSAGDIPTAARFIESWIEENPRHLGSRHLYGQMLMREQDWSKAQSVYEELQAAGVEDVVLLNNLATCYRHLGDPRALPTAQAAYDMAPNDPRVADTYGWILTQEGRVEEGLALLREAFARASTSPQIRYHIGLALAQLGRADEAREEIEAALDANERFSAREEARSLLERLRESFR